MSATTPHTGSTPPGHDHPRSYQTQIHNKLRELGTITGVSQPALFEAFLDGCLYEYAGRPPTHTNPVRVLSGAQNYCDRRELSRRFGSLFHTLLMALNDEHVTILQELATDPTNTPGPRQDCSPVRTVTAAPDSASSSGFPLLIGQNPDHGALVDTIQDVDSARVSVCFRTCHPLELKSTGLLLAAMHSRVSGWILATPRRESGQAAIELHASDGCGVSLHTESQPPNIGNRLC